MHAYAGGKKSEVANNPVRHEMKRGRDVRDPAPAYSFRSVKLSVSRVRKITAHICFPHLTTFTNVKQNFLDGMAVSVRGSVKKIWCHAHDHHFQNATRLYKLSESMSDSDSGAQKSP